MKQETLNQIKKEISKVYDIYSKLVIKWNGNLAHGNSATHPITIIIDVILQNMSFNGNNCHNYDLKEDIKDLYNDLRLLKELNEYNNKGYMTHFPYIECESIIDGFVFSEDEDNFHITEIPLYIPSYMTSLKTDFKTLEIPIGTKLEFVKYGDENEVYSTDPIHANCYSGKTDSFSFDSKFLYTDPCDGHSFYDKK